jgi:hypothetical protein
LAVGIERFMNISFGQAKERTRKKRNLKDVYKE